LKCEKTPIVKKMELAAVLHALSDPVRLHIVRLAAQGERACNAFGLKLPKTTLFHHFHVLRNAGVIESRPVGTKHMTRVRKKEMDAAFPGLLKAVLGAEKRVASDAAKRGVRKVS
jgi:DNA-binding transcriptional ArsR family regulator